jgi:hypothetical protein
MLSPFRTLTPVKSVKLNRLLAGSAIAVAAALTGSLAAWSTGLASHPAGVSHVASASHPAAASDLAGSGRVLASHGAAVRLGAAVGHSAVVSHSAAVSPGADSSAAAGQLASLSRSPVTESEPPRLDAFLATPAKPQVTTGGGKGRKAARLTPRQIARRLLPKFHWSRRQFRYLDPLWERESSWNVRAFNGYSGAYGIPQAVPGAKMASAGPDWRSSARTQIRWGLRYIKAEYGSPRAAWDHELATGWY